MSLLSDAQVIEAVNRHSARSAAVVHREMTRGLNSLASIVSTAPWVGILGTLLGIVNSFVACGCEKSTWIEAIVERLAQSLVPTALGLLVAIPTWCGYRYCCSVVESFDMEMENASGELVNCLMIHLRRRK